MFFLFNLSITLKDEYILIQSLLIYEKSVDTL